MEMNMQKVMDTLGDSVKLAANLTEVTKMGGLIPSDNSNNNESNPSQTVQIQIADKDPSEKKPTILREKHETHIHKEFPDNRSLTDAECDLALKKATMENELKKMEMEAKMKREELERADRLAKEERERKEKEERRIRNEKKSKVRSIIAACIAALGTVAVGYAIHRDNKNSANSFNTPIKGEGKVE